jgi:hypothetical protein
MSHSSSTQEPSGTSASNVDIIDPNTSSSKNSNTSNEGSTKFSGPGTSASKPGGVQPHSSKLLNKLDPRLDSDLIEEVNEGRLKEKPST